MPDDERPEEESPEEKKPDEEQPKEELSEESPGEAPQPKDEAPEEPESPEKPPKKAGKGRNIGAVAALAVIAILIGFVLFSRTAPYQAMRLRSSSTVTRINALDRLENMEEDAVRNTLPAVARAVGDPEVPVRSKAANLLNTIGDVGPDVIKELIKILEDADMPTENKLLVAQVIPNLGENAKDAIPALLNLARKNEPAALRAAALQSADRISPNRADVIDAVFSKFTEGEQPVRNAAINISGVNARRNEEVLARILNKADEADPQMRQSAVEALRALGTLDDRSLPRIMKALEDDADIVRQAASSALGAAMNSYSNIDKIREASGGLGEEARDRLEQQLRSARERLDRRR